MALVLAKTNNMPAVIDYIENINERLNTGTPLGKMFEGKFSYFIDWKKIYIYGHMTPIFPRFYYIGILGLLAVAVFKGTLNTGWIIAPGVIALMGFFWSSAFYYSTFKAGLRKCGYRGNIKRITRNTCLKVLINA